MENFFLEEVNSTIIACTKDKILANRVCTTILRGSLFDTMMGVAERALIKEDYQSAAARFENLIELYPDYPEIDKIKADYQKAISMLPVQTKKNNGNQTYKKGFMTLIINQ